MTNLWTSSEHALEYLSRADKMLHRTEGEAVLLDLIPKDVQRILDLGTGNGRLLALLKIDRPQTHAIALDFSPAMIQAASERFSGDDSVKIIQHDLDQSLPPLGEFDAVVSSFAIHHLNDDRKRSLYAEVFSKLKAGGVFCNLEHVSSPTQRLHEIFMQKLEAREDPSNQLLDVETQLRWLREIGFEEVDCYWKWREMALLAGVKPS